ncbi:hypothetical protein A2U01_0004875, partial [Trifolium medium]|nr:hypothetical protein [Trifolium medium]
MSSTPTEHALQHMPSTLPTLARARLRSVSCRPSTDLGDRRPNRENRWPRAGGYKYNLIARYKPPLRGGPSTTAWNVKQPAVDQPLWNRYDQWRRLWERKFSPLSLPTKRKKNQTSLPSEMAGSSVQRTNGDSTPYVDADGRPMTTIISPRQNPPQDRTVIPMGTDERIATVNDEFDRRDGEEIAISDDENSYNIVTTNPPDSGNSLPDFARRGTLALKRAAAARARRDHVKQEQELHITLADLKKLLISLGDHQELIQEQRELIREQDRRLKAADRVNSHRRPDCADRLLQGSKKRGRTPPRRKPPSVTTKRGRGTTIFDRLGEKLAITRRGGGRGHVSPPSPRLERRSRSPSLSPRENIYPDYEAYGSDKDEGYGPLSLEILNAPLPPGLERPPKLAKYDGQGDPDEHISVFNIQLDYLRVSGDIKCRLFSTALTKKALDWYKTLPRDSIHSWSQLSKQFRSRFTASRRPPKTIASLEAIVQRREETLRAYIERFSSEATQVTAEDNMKRYLLERG